MSWANRAHALRGLRPLWRCLDGEIKPKQTVGSVHCLDKKLRMREARKKTPIGRVPRRRRLFVVLNPTFGFQNQKTCDWLIRSCEPWKIPRILEKPSGLTFATHMPFDFIPLGAKWPLRLLFSLHKLFIVLRTWQRAQHGRKSNFRHGNSDFTPKKHSEILKLTFWAFYVLERESCSSSAFACVRKLAQCRLFDTLARFHCSARRPGMGFKSKRHGPCRIELEFFSFKFDNKSVKRVHLSLTVLLSYQVQYINTAAVDWSADSVERVFDTHDW